MPSFSGSETLLNLDYVMWKSIDELHHFQDEPKDVFLHFTFKKKVEHMAACFPLAPLKSIEIPLLPSPTFHVHLHELLYPDSARRCIHKILRQIPYLDSPTFQDLKDRISFFATAKAREAYSAGCNTLTIVSEVEILIAHFYHDGDTVDAAMREETNSRALNSLMG